MLEGSPRPAPTKLLTRQTRKCHVAAQAGYDDYCKRCLITLFAALHRAKQLQRLKPCIACMEQTELYATVYGSLAPAGA